MANQSLESSTSPDYHANNDKEEPQRCCVICSRTSPKTIFSCRYKVHERNIDVLQAFFGRPPLRFGELCDRCYRNWYKHKRAKTTPTPSNNNSATPKKKKDETQEESMNMGVLSHEAFHHAPSERPKGITKSNKVQSALKPQVPKADFTYCLKALSVIAKPPRKSRRKNTPVRSAPKLDALYEFMSTTANKTQAAYLMFAALDIEKQQPSYEQEPMDDEEEEEYDEEATESAQATEEEKDEQVSHHLTDSLLAAAASKQDAIAA